MNFLPNQARFIYLNNKVRPVSVAVFKKSLVGMPTIMIIQTYIGCLIFHRFNHKHKDT